MDSANTTCVLLCVPVVFPQDILEKGLAANNFAMLGLGDIVIPGIFIALLLRFDIRSVHGTISSSLKTVGTAVGATVPDDSAASLLLCAHLSYKQTYASRRLCQQKNVETMLEQLLELLF